MYACIHINPIPSTHPWTQSAQRGSKENKGNVDRKVAHALVKIMPRVERYICARSKSKDGSKRPSQTIKTKHRFHASQIDDCAPPEFISLRLMFVRQFSYHAGIKKKYSCRTKCPVIFPITSQFRSATNPTSRDTRDVDVVKKKA